MPDGDGKYRAVTDGLLIYRFLTSPFDAGSITGIVASPAVGGTATRIARLAILDYMDNISNLFDVNLDGLYDATDSTLILRYLFGFRGTALVAGLTLPAGMTTAQFAAMVEANMAAITLVLP